MLIVLPEWYSKAEEKLWKMIDDIAIENDIDFHFVHDSKNIHDAVETILSVMVHIGDKVESDIKSGEGHDKNIQHNKRK
jgi:hypothetical protein